MPTPRLELATGLALLRDGSFARLWGARFISAFGTSMAPIALAFALLDLTGRAEAIGQVLACQIGAQVATLLFGGTLADRFDRRRMMVWADGLAALSQGASAGLILSGDVAIWQLMVLQAVTGVAFAFHGPAAVGLIPQLVPRDKLQPANALLSLSQSGALSLGAAGAGILVALLGAGYALAVDAGTFALSAALIAGTRPRAQQRGAAATLWRELRDGWREFTSHRWLWTIVLQFSVLVAAWEGGFGVVGPTVAQRALGGATDWGWIASAFGVGTLVGGLVGIRLHVVRQIRFATFAILTHALPLLLLIGPAPVAVVALGAFCAGIGGSLFGLFWFTTLHTQVAPEALSRVSAYDHLGSMALAPLGVIAAGYAVERLGAPTTLWIAAAGIVLPTLAVLAVPEVRQLRGKVDLDERAE